MIWTPFLTPKMKGFIFGFQRRVWWPKWTPASRSWRMVKVGIAMGGLSFLRFEPPRALCLGLAEDRNGHGGMSPRRADDARVRCRRGSSPSWGWNASGLPLPGRLFRGRGDRFDLDQPARVGEPRHDDERGGGPDLPQHAVAQGAVLADVALARDVGRNLDQVD